MKIQISDLDNKGDARGVSFTAPLQALQFVGRMLDVHVSSSQPGTVRGNHYHLRRREAIVILPGTSWSFHWDEGEQTPAQHRSFNGDHAILILVSPDASHAIPNDGSETLWLLAISSEIYDAEESVTRKVV